MSTQMSQGAKKGGSELWSTIVDQWPWLCVVAFLGCATSWAAINVIQIHTNASLWLNSPTAFGGISFTLPFVMLWAFFTAQLTQQYALAWMTAWVTQIILLLTSIGITGAMRIVWEDRKLSADQLDLMKGSIGLRKKIIWFCMSVATLYDIGSDFWFSYQWGAPQALFYTIIFSAGNYLLGTASILFLQAAFLQYKGRK